MSSQGCQVPHVAAPLVLEEVVQIAGRTALIAVHLQFLAVNATRGFNPQKRDLYKYNIYVQYIYIYV